MRKVLYKKWIPAERTPEYTEYLKTHNGDSFGFMDRYSVDGTGCFTDFTNEGLFHSKEMKTSIQETELYKKFIAALDIHDMRSDGNPFALKCCKIAEEYASQSLPSEEEIKDLYLIRNYFGDHDKTTFEHFAYSFLNRLLSRLQPSGNSEQLKDIS